MVFKAAATEPSLVTSITTGRGPSRSGAARPRQPHRGDPLGRLCKARLQIVGSGQGSVSTCEYVAELGALAEAIAVGVDARPVPLAQVKQAWADTEAAARHRRVLVPRP
jgi:hypothetical protein